MKEGGCLNELQRTQSQLKPVEGLTISSDNFIKCWATANMKNCDEICDALLEHITDILVQTKQLDSAQGK